MAGGIVIAIVGDIISSAAVIVVEGMWWSKESNTVQNCFFVKKCCTDPVCFVESKRGVKKVTRPVSTQILFSLV